MVPTVVGSMVVVDALTRCTLFQSVGDLKATQVNVQPVLISELILYDFKLGHEK